MLFVETVLVLFIVWLVVRKKPKKQSDLTPADVDDLISDWRPLPLVPSLSDADRLELSRQVSTSARGSTNARKAAAGEHACRFKG